MTAFAGAVFGHVFFWLVAAKAAPFATNTASAMAQAEAVRDMVWVAVVRGIRILRLVKLGWVNTLLRRIPGNT